MNWKLIAILGLNACAVSIDQEQVFRPNEANRRSGISVIDIQGEERLPEGVSLRHDYLTSRAGAIATTLAQTGSERLIVGCMGNAADRISDGVGYLEGFVPFGDALIFDYPGYGDSAGTPSLGDFNSAVMALEEWVSNTDYKEIIIWGHSLGGFVCAELVSQMSNAPDAVIFETSASNVSTVAFAWTPWYAKLFVRMKIEEGLKAYDNISALDGFSGSILVIGASEDEQLPVTLSRDLARRFTDAGNDVTYVELEGAEHMNVSTHADYEKTVSQFLDTLEK